MELLLIIRLIFQLGMNVDAKNPLPFKRGSETSKVNENRPLPPEQARAQTKQDVARMREGMREKEARQIVDAQLKAGLDQNGLRQALKTDILAWKEKINLAAEFDQHAQDELTMAQAKLTYLDKLARIPPEVPPRSTEDPKGSPTDVLPFPPQHQDPTAQYDKKWTPAYREPRGSTQTEHLPS